MNKIAIVLGAFHKKEMEQMLVFVKDEIKKHSSMEKPLAVKKLLLNKEIEAVVIGHYRKRRYSTRQDDGRCSFTCFDIFAVGIFKTYRIGILGPEITQNQIEERLEPYARKSITVF